VDLDNNWGWYALAGIDVPVWRVGLFGEAKWLELSTDGHFTSGAESGTTTNLKANGLGINIGVMFQPKI
jgi:hypothetical protein